MKIATYLISLNYTLIIITSVRVNLTDSLLHVREEIY